MNIPIPKKTIILENLEKLTLLKVNESNWKIVTINKNHFTVSENGIYNFKVYYQIIDNIVYLKPFLPVKTSEFEILFRFGVDCSNYDEDRIIYVSNPSDYYKYFF